MTRPSQSLKTRALALLARREHSRLELIRKLGYRGADPAEISQVLDELTASGLLSDERYARSLVTQKSNAYSRRYLSEELKAKGVPAEYTTVALEEASIAGVNDDTVLRVLWQRRFGTPPAGDREKARQVRFLQSRGFGLSQILRFLRQLGDSHTEHQD